MTARWRDQRRGLATIIAVALLGLAVTAYVLLHQRFPNPFVDTYSVDVELPAADGVTPGMGQPVTVAGVHVGTISGARLEGGAAVVSMTIDRAQLPHIYRDGTASLRPITPLEDMELLLDPGSPDAGALDEGDTIPLSQASSPASLDELLSSLDTDTRTFLRALITSAGTGTEGQGANMRRALIALGPTARQMRTITESIAERRHQLARLVHNFAVLTRAASRDDDLATLVAAGNATLGAIAEQDAPLQRSIKRLPRVLGLTAETLARTTRFADELEPTIAALDPAVEKLPAALESLGPYAERAAPIVENELRPFVRQATPAAHDLAPAIQDLNAITPSLTNSFKVLTYLGNEMAYNAPGNDEGFLFWLAFFSHNVNSLFSLQDAHGGLLRATPFVSCSLITGTGEIGELLGQTLNLAGAC